MSKKYSSAGDAVYTDDFDDVLAVLSGPSPWRAFIEPNLKQMRSKLSRASFQVVGEKDYQAVLDRLKITGNARSIPGVTDKYHQTITMLEYKGQNSGQSYLGASLHECVHLVSHPVDANTSDHSTAIQFLGVGLLEGLVECVTEDILVGQNIPLVKDTKKRGHQERERIVRAMFQDVTADWGNLLFQGQQQPFVSTMEQTYSPTGWQHLKNIAGAANDVLALQLMANFKKQQQAKAPRVVKVPVPVFR
jgi:hypothetical protein